MTHVIKRGSWTIPVEQSPQPMVTIEDRMTMHPADFAKFLDERVSLLFRHYDDAHRTKFYIVSEHELTRYGTGFWSSEDGWTTLESATRFVSDDVIRNQLPASEGEVKWVDELNAQALAAEHENEMEGFHP
jgi:hypothetical protein